MTGQINIVFDQRGLEGTLAMLRCVAGEDGPDIGDESAESNFQEVLRLAEIIDGRLDLSGELFKIDSKLVVTEGASETFVVLEPTERLRSHLAALGVQTLQR